MNILVIGGGHLGRNLAEELDSLGHDVVIIEEDEEKLKELSDDFKGLSYSFFPMDIENLKKSGIESCDAIAVVTPDDNLNITVAQIAKNIFGIEKVISRITDPMREEFFNALGLKTICPTNMAAESLISAIFDEKDNVDIRLGVSMLGLRVRTPDKKDINRFLYQASSLKDEIVVGMLDKNGRFTLNKNDLSVVVDEDSLLVYIAKCD